MAAACYQPIRWCRPGAEDSAGAVPHITIVPGRRPSDPELWVRCYYQGTWVLAPHLPGIVSIQQSFVPRRGDVVLASPPKCGTTWLKALAFATVARGAYPPGDTERHPLSRLNPHECVPFMEMLFADGSGSGKMDALPSPRLMATHMPHSVLPPSIKENAGCKIIYVCREPKDMQAANPEKVLFLRYDEMLRDPVGNVKKLAQFVGQPFSPAEEDAGVVMDVVRLCSFDKLKNLEINKAGSGSLFANDSYFRKGGVGDWTPDMARRLDAVVDDKLRGSGLSFA
ncbi:unnamed protein product [Urochloa decumbens]|uniref:Sulfotransferase n=1 Tax=Urochloa decumbens TaxID=240449 RepID=A0ABC9G082_9POAL